MNQIYKNQKKFLCDIEYHLIFFKYLYIYIIYNDNFDNQCITIVYETTVRIFYNYTCKNIVLLTATSIFKSIIFKLFLDIEMIEQ